MPKGGRHAGSLFSKRQRSPVSIGGAVGNKEGSLGGLGATLEQNGKIQGTLQEMLKQMQNIADVHKKKAAEMPGPPKEPIVFRNSAGATVPEHSGGGDLPAPNNVFNSADGNRVKEQIGGLMKMLQEASSVATDITWQFGSSGVPQDEQLEHIFRAHQRQEWYDCVMKKYEIELYKKPATQASEKNPMWSYISPLSSSSSMILMGTAVIGGGSKESRMTKKLAFAKLNPSSSAGWQYDAQGIVYMDVPKLDANSNSILVYPLCLFQFQTDFYIICNCVVQPSAASSSSSVAAKDKMVTSGASMTQVIIIKSKIFGGGGEKEEQQQQPPQVRNVEGLFEKGLQAVDYYQAADGKIGYLLVRGLYANRTTGHGLAVLNTTNGLVDRWIPLTNLPPYSQLHSFLATTDPTSKLRLQGIVKQVSADRLVAPTKNLIVEFDLAKQQLDIQVSLKENELEGTGGGGKGAEYCRKRMVVGSNGELQLCCFNMPQYQQTGRMPPQALCNTISKDKWCNGTLALPDTFQIQQAYCFSTSVRYVWLVGSVVENGNSEFLVARLPY